MGDFRIVRSLVGDTWETRQGIADEALEEGDICNFDGDGELEKVGNDADEQDLVIVLEDADTDQTGVSYTWLHPWIEIEGHMMDTVGEVGDLVKLDVTGGAISFEAGTQALARFMLTEVAVGGDADKVRAVRFTGMNAS